MKPPGSAKAFTSDAFTTEKCQSRFARLVREAIDCPSAVTNRSMAVSRMSGISESIFAASPAPMARSCCGVTEHAAATERETNPQNATTKRADLDPGRTDDALLGLRMRPEAFDCAVLVSASMRYPPMMVARVAAIGPAWIYSLRRSRRTPCRRFRGVRRTWRVPRARV